MNYDNKKQIHCACRR